MALFREETAQLPMAVVVWMWAMRIGFGASIVFLPRPGAIATLGVMAATALLRFYIKGAQPDMPAVQIGSLVHAVLWLPLLAFLIFSAWKQNAPAVSIYDRAYASWRLVVIAMLSISLAFDIGALLKAHI